MVNQEEADEVGGICRIMGREGEVGVVCWCIHVGVMLKRFHS